MVFVSTTNNLSGMNHQTKSGTKIVAFSNRFLTNKKENEMQGQLKGFHFMFIILT